MHTTVTSGLGTRAVLRLTTDADPTWVDLTAGGVDLERGIVQPHEGEPCSLTSMERKALAYLVAHPRRDVSHEELLAQVWGYAAGVHSRAAYFTVRRIRAKIEVDPKTPQHLLTVHGVGYCFVPLEAEMSAPRRTTNLAMDLGPFLGRSHELDTLSSWAAAGERLITVVGPAGVGKTRLLRRHGWAGATRGGDAEQIWFCDLTGARHAATMVDIVAQGIGVDRVGAADGADRVGRALAGRGRVVLLLDNLEQGIAAARGLVQRWLGEAIALSVVCTSREPLHVPGERILTLAPLDSDAAVALFSDLAQAQGLSPEATEAHHTLIRDLVAPLRDHLPLAIELAAARCTVLDPAQIRDRLVDRFTLLRPSASGAGGQRSLRGALDGSWDLLTPDEAHALMQLSVFPTGFWLDDAEAVLSASCSGGGALDRIQALVQKSLLHVTRDGGRPRLGAYVSVAAYAAEHLDASGGRPDAVRGHADRYLSLGEALIRRHTEGDPAALRLLRLERPHLDAIVDRRISPEISARGGLILDALLLTVAPDDDRTASLARILPLVDQLPPDLAARICIATRRDVALEQATSLAQAHGDPALTAVVGVARATAALAAGQVDRAVQHAEAAEAAARQTGDPVRIESALQCLLKAHTEGSAFEAAQGVAETLRGIRRDHGLDGLPTHNLGLLACRLADHTAWEQNLLHDLSVYRARGQRVEEAWTRHNLGTLRVSRGEVAAAQVDLAAAEALATQLGLDRLSALVCQARFGLAIEAMDLPEMDRLSARSLSLAGDAGRPRAVALLDRTIVALYGDLPDLRSRADIAVDAAIACQDRVIGTCARLVHALAMALDGEGDQADAAWTDATAWIRGAACPRDLPAMADLIRGMLAVVRARGGEDAAQHMAHAREALDVARRVPPEGRSLAQEYQSVRILANFLAGWIATFDASHATRGSSSERSPTTRSAAAAKRPEPS